MGRWMRDNVLGLVAIFIALTGTAYAATAAKNSVTSKSIKPSAVRSGDVKNETLTDEDIADSVTAGLRGPQGPQGDRGPQGERGPEGPPGGGGPPSGAAGGDLTGSYPAPDVASNAIGGSEVADDSLDGFDIANLDGASIANGAINSARLQDGEVGAVDLSSAVRPRRVDVFLTHPAGGGPVEQTLFTIGDTTFKASCSELFGGDTAGGLYYESTVQSFLDKSAKVEDDVVGSREPFEIGTSVGSGSPGLLAFPLDGSPGNPIVGREMGTYIYTGNGRTILINAAAVVRTSDNSCSINGVVSPAS